MKTLDLERPRDREPAPSESPRDEPVHRTIARHARPGGQVAPEAAATAWSFGDAINAGIHTTIARAADGAGHGIPDGLRARFEASLGADLGGVRVHTDGAAADASAALGARAYAVGQDVYMGAGQYAPGTADGAWLLAHEVAHTVQQRGAATGPQAKLEISEPGDAIEREADDAASAMIAGRPAVVTAAPGVARKILPNRDKPAVVDDAWWHDEDALADFLYKVAKLGYRAAIEPVVPGAIVEVETPSRANPQAAEALVHVHAAALLARPVRTLDAGSEKASLAFAQWTLARPLVDRALAAYGKLGNHDRDYRSDIERVDRVLADKRAEHDVIDARRDAAFKGEDELLLAHKEIVIKAIEQAKETCLKAREAAREHEAKQGVETVETGKKAAETAHKAVAPDPGSVGDQATKQAHAQAGHVELEPVGGAVREVGLEALDAVLLVLKAGDVGAALRNAKGPLEKVKAIGQLFEYAINVATTTVSLTLDSVALVVRRSMPAAAAQLGKVSGGIKNFTGTWVGRAMALFNVVTGTLDLIAAIRRGDTEAAIRAGGTITSALVGVGSQMMKMGGPFGAILSIYLQEVVEAVIAIGRMGAALRQAATNRTTQEVATIAHDGGELARCAAGLAQAWQGQIGAMNEAGDPAKALAGAYAAQVRGETDGVRRVAKTLAADIAVLDTAQIHSPIAKGVEIATFLGEPARTAIADIARSELEPFTLVKTCRDAVLPGLQNLVHASLRIAGTMSPDALMNGGLQHIAGK